MFHLLHLHFIWCLSKERKEESKYELYYLYWIFGIFRDRVLEKGKLCVLGLRSKWLNIWLHDDGLFTLSNGFALKTNEEQLSSFPPVSVQVWRVQMTLLGSSWSSLLPLCSSAWFVPFLYPPEWTQTAARSQRCAYLIPAGRRPEPL